QSPFCGTLEGVSRKLVGVYPRAARRARWMESTAAQLTLLSLAEVWDRVDPLSPDLQANPAQLGLGALPYQELKGPGFERLCYELLVAEGHSPRFFGRSGEMDYGVDIIV